MKTSASFTIIATVFTSFSQAATIKLCTEPGGCSDFPIETKICLRVPPHIVGKPSYVDTGGPRCAFYRDQDCIGDFFHASGSNPTFPKRSSSLVSSVFCY
ncbi:hypothetical protein E6O75_ATG06563 [Venturia nashicola]|uniref:Uncharacterized protein n=1 Tax=Venturia nashicola TaxID=86259 RepID=A0A4Z1NR22_9PEZI|nr:hypothetical protein E6O75_ATG06563 [Venturia nashicola]